jgi:hypothetical protein
VKDSEQDRFPELQAGQQVMSADGKPIGTVLEVFRGIGDVETFGAAGIPPQQEGFDAQHYAYSEAMPGAGDDYVTVDWTDGDVLYLPFSYISGVEKGQVTVAVDGENIPDMSWTVRPDALTSVEHEYETDTGADPKVA